MRIIRHGVQPVATCLSILPFSKMTIIHSQSFSKDTVIHILESESKHVSSDFEIKKNNSNCKIMGSKMK